MLQLLHKNSINPKNIFKRILKSQFSRFFRICYKIRDFNEPWQILPLSLCKRKYAKLWLRHIKRKAIRKLSIQQRRINPYNPTNSEWGPKPCGISGCRSCEILCFCRNVTSPVTNQIHGIIGNLNCGSSNIIYVCEYQYCSK